ncbi:unnamed protein product, partial [Heterosigma akashiwo]
RLLREQRHALPAGRGGARRRLPPEQQVPGWGLPDRGKRRDGAQSRGLSQRHRPELGRGEPRLGGRLRRGHGSFLREVHRRVPQDAGADPQRAGVLLPSGVRARRHGRADLRCGGGGLAVGRRGGVFRLRHQRGLMLPDGLEGAGPWRVRLRRRGGGVPRV